MATFTSVRHTNKIIIIIINKCNNQYHINTHVGLMWQLTRWTWTSSLLPWLSSFYCYRKEPLARFIGVRPIIVPSPNHHKHQSTEGNLKNWPQSQASSFLKHHLTSNSRGGRCWSSQPSYRAMQQAYMCQNSCGQIQQHPVKCTLMSMSTITEKVLAGNENSCY